MVDFFPALIFFHRILCIFLLDKKRKISLRETEILISNLTSYEKLLVMYLNRVKKFFTTCVYLCYYKYLFLAHRSSVLRKIT